MSSMLTTLDTSHFEISPVNAVASSNMVCMSVTLDTSHFEILPLNEVAPRNRELMSVTSDTSHSAIEPCGPLAQSPTADILKHSSSKSLRSLWFLGGNTVKVRVGIMGSVPSWIEGEDGGVMRIQTNFRLYRIAFLSPPFANPGARSLATLITDYNVQCNEPAFLLLPLLFVALPSLLFVMVVACNQEIASVV